MWNTTVPGNWWNVKCENFWKYETFVSGNGWNVKCENFWKYETFVSGNGWNVKKIFENVEYLVC